MLQYYQFCTQLRQTFGDTHFMGLLSGSEFVNGDHRPYSYFYVVHTGMRVINVTYMTALRYKEMLHDTGEQSILTLENVDISQLEGFNTLFNRDHFEPAAGIYFNFMREHAQALQNVDMSSYYHVIDDEEVDENDLRTQVLQLLNLSINISSESLKKKIASYVKENDDHRILYDIKLTLQQQNRTMDDDQIRREFQNHFDEVRRRVELVKRLDTS